MLLLQNWQRGFRSGACKAKKLDHAEIASGARQVGGVSVAATSGPFSVPKTLLRVSPEIFRCVR